MLEIHTKLYVENVYVQGNMAKINLLGWEWNNFSFSLPFQLRLLFTSLKSHWKPLFSTQLFTNNVVTKLMQNTPGLNSWSDRRRFICVLIKLKINYVWKLKITHISKHFTAPSNRQNLNFWRCCVQIFSCNLHSSLFGVWSEYLLKQRLKPIFWIESK